MAAQIPKLKYYRSSFYVFTFVIVTFVFVLKLLDLGLCNFFAMCFIIIFASFNIVF